MLVTKDNLGEVRAALSKEFTLALDTETTGLEYQDRPFALVIASEKEAYYFDERVIPDFWYLGDVKSIFMAFPKTWILQNAKFDMRMLATKGLSLTNMRNKVVDIEVQARIQRNDHMRYSLDAQAKRIGDRKFDEVEAYVKEHKLYEMRKDFFGKEYKAKRYDRVPMEVMQPYAEQDARLTLKLYNYYNVLMDEDDKSVLMSETLLTPIVFKMEQEGVRLDVTKTLGAYHSESSKVEELKEKYKGITGNSFVDSAKSIQKALPNYELPRTAKGNPSFTDDVISAILSSDPDAYTKQVVELIRDMRYFEKRISTYYKPFLNKQDPEGFIHCNMKQAGTRTGRFSSADPNLQNVPKEEDSTDEYVVRGCFIPREGHVFVSMDYAQMEYRMMAAYAGQTDVIKRVMKGEDFHQVTADLFGVTRKTAKTLNFAILYGAGVEKIAGMLGVSVLEAKRLKDKYFMALPKVERFIDQVIGTGKARGHVFNWLGRKMYAEPDFAYALPNHLIQGGGADIVKAAMVRIGQEFPKVKMVMQIHDQLVFDMHPSQFQHICRIKEIMENIWSEEGMKLTVDVSWSGTSLAERDLKKGLPI